MRIRASGQPVLLGLLLLVSFPIFLFGLFYPDEGYMLHTASRLLDGEVMYREFHFVYTPVAAWLLAGFFMFFGESVLSGRVLAYILTGIGIVSLFLILREYSKKTVWIFLSLGIFISWGAFHINFIWPTMVAISFTLLACLFYTKSIRDVRLMIGVGICSMMVVLSKQNLGVAILSAFFISIIAERWTIVRVPRSRLIFYLVGVLALTVSFVTYLVIQGSFSDFLQNNYLNLVQKIIVEGTIATPFLYGTGFYSYGKLLFYLSPLVLCVPALWLACRSRSPLIILPIICIVVFVAGVRPVTDYVHLSPLVSLGSLPVFVLSIFLKQHVQRFLLLVYAICLILIGVYLPFFRYYYRWQEPIIRQNHFVNQNRVMVFAESKYASEIPALRGYIDSIAGKKEYVYINYYAPMVYFFLDRPNPTKYDYVSGSGLSEYEHRDIVKNLKEKKVMIAITHAIVQNDTSLPYLYISRNFVMKKRIGDLLVWQKK